jgi:hypothetical protein
VAVLQGRCLHREPSFAAWVAVVFRSQSLADKRKQVLVEKHDLRHFRHVESEIERLFVADLLICGLVAERWLLTSWLHNSVQST